MKKYVRQSNDLVYLSVDDLLVLQTLEAGQRRLAAERGTPPGSDTAVSLPVPLPLLHSLTGLKPTAVTHCLELLQRHRLASREASELCNGAGGAGSTAPCYRPTWRGLDLLNVQAMFGRQLVRVGSDAAAAKSSPREVN